MKNIILIIAIFIVQSISASASSYSEAMGTNIQKMYTTHDVAQLTEIANSFERIGENEQTEWLPFYYAAYANVSVLFFSQNLTADEKNSYLDKAQEKLDKALKISKTESENHVLQALIYQLRITDPSLGYKFSTLANASLSKAEKLNAKNPRVYHLKANNLFYTPKEYGGGVEVAKPLFEKAALLFQTTVNENPLLPNWGNENNKAMLERCK